MANPLLALQVQPLDISGAVNPLVAGLQQRWKNQAAEQEKNVLAQILGPALAGGDLTKAAAGALAVNKPELALKLHEMNEEQKKAKATELATLVMMATEETYPQIRQSIIDKYGVEPPPELPIAQAEAVADAGEMGITLLDKATDNARADRTLDIQEQTLARTEEERRTDNSRDQRRLDLEEERVRIAQERSDSSAARNASPLERERAKADVGTVTEYRKDADSGRELLSTIQQLRGARQGVDYEGGMAAGTRARVGGWLGSGKGQTVQSLATDLQLGFTERTKGAISDREMAMFGSATPGLEMTDAAAENRLAGMEAGARRVVERAKFFESWLDENNKLAGAQEAWDRYVEENPIIETTKDGDIKVNKKNVTNWLSYVSDDASLVAGAAGETGIPPAAQAAGITPEEWAGLDETEREVWR